MVAKIVPLKNNIPRLSTAHTILSQVLHLQHSHTRSRVDLVHNGAQRARPQSGGRMRRAQSACPHPGGRERSVHFDVPLSKQRCWAPPIQETPTHSALHRWVDCQEEEDLEHVANQEGLCERAAQHGKTFVRKERCTRSDTGASGAARIVCIVKAHIRRTPAHN
eukprot:6906046-Prymnesium_polylepis.1